jgi:hypothetical protein
MRVEVIKIDGTIDPKDLVVYPGERLLFQSRDAFEVDFSGNSPDWANPDPHRVSFPEGNGHVIKMTARDETGTYAYVLRINGKVIDPAIIIK